MNRSLFAAFIALVFLGGCASHKMEYGVVERGSVFYPLCEKAQQRITDMQRISFELPPLFKQAPCRNWPDYSYDLRSDRLNVVIPGVIANESQMSVGGVHSMSFFAGLRREYFLSPEGFFEDYSDYLSERREIAALVTASWVNWSGGRCARFYSEADTGIFLRRILEYTCWESVSGSSFPIHIKANENLPYGYTPTNLDREMIEPVLTSLQIHPVPAERLAFWAGEKAEFCSALKANFDEKKALRMGDRPDRRRSVRFLRECGYEVPDPVGVGSWGELFKPGGRLIGRADGEESLRRLSPEQFAELEARLMSLLPAPGVRPEIRVQTFTADRKGLVESYRATGPYAGDWYRVPPSYNDRYGFGIRNDPLLGRVIDVHLGSGGMPPGLRIAIE